MGPQAFARIRRLLFTGNPVSHCPSPRRNVVRATISPWPTGSFTSFNLIRYRHHDDSTFLYAFDLIELNGDDLRRDPLEVRKATLRSTLAKAGLGLRFNEHLEGDGPTVFAMPASLAWKASSRSARIPPTVPAARRTGSK
jgi:hypothetical protein